MKKTEITLQYLFFLLAIFTFFCFVSCRETTKERLFFPLTKDTIFLSNNFYWFIDSISYSKGGPGNDWLYKTIFSFPDRELVLLTSFTKKRWVMCNAKGAKCNVVFDVEDHTMKNIDDILKTKLLFSSNENHIFSYTVAGGRAHSPISDLLIWNISEHKGLTALGYYDKYSCSFEKVMGDTVLLSKHSLLICESLSD